MNKKAQVSLYIILGLIIVLLVALFYLSFSNQDNLEEEFRKVSTLSEMRIDMHAYIKTCIRDAVKDGMSRAGIRQDTIEEYEQIVEDEVVKCTDSLFEILKTQGKDISTGVINSQIQLNDETVIIEVDYPITISTNSQKAKFQFFEETFDKTIIHKIPGGIVLEETKIISNNRKAQIKIPEGVKITDREGNQIGQVGLKVEDLHFDGLENNVVIGNIVYEGLPDGAFFSEPVEISIEFDEKDIPEGFTKENLRVSWWDEDFGIWWALPTQIVKNRMIAQTTHFTMFSGAGVLPQNEPFDGESWVFRERFNDCNGEICSCSGDSFNIVEKQNKDYVIEFKEDVDYRDFKKDGIINSEQKDITKYVTYGEEKTTYNCNNPIPNYKEDDGTLDVDYSNKISDISWDGSKTCPTEDEAKEILFGYIPDTATYLLENAEIKWNSQEYEMIRQCLGRELGVSPNPNNNIVGVCEICVPSDYPNVELNDGEVCTCIPESRLKETDTQRGWKTNDCLSGQTVAESFIPLGSVIKKGSIFPYGKTGKNYDQNSVASLNLEPKGNTVIDTIFKKAQEFVGKVTSEEFELSKKIVVVPTLIEESADCEIINYDDGLTVHQIYGKENPKFAIKGVKCTDTIMSVESKNAFNQEATKGANGDDDILTIKANLVKMNKEDYYDACSKAGVEWFVSGQGIKLSANS